MAFILTELIILLTIVGLSLVLSAVWPPDSPWAPWWQMPEDVIYKMCRLARISPNDTIYDLGCGTGKALCIAAKEYGAKGVGIEIDPVRFWLAQWNVGRFHVTGKVSLYKKNFFDVKLNEASVIFVYLVPKALSNISQKFFSELQPGTRLITYIYDFPEKEYQGRLKLLHHDTKSKIFIYKLLS